MNFIEEVLNLNEFLQIRIILLLTIFLIIYYVLRQTNILSGNKPVIGIISLVISIIAVRAISDSVIELIGISSKYLGLFFIYTAILLTITLIVHRKDTTALIRKSLITLFAGAFIFVFYNQYELLSESGKITSWILGALTLSIILLDKYLHQWVRYRFG